MLWLPAESALRVASEAGPAGKRESVRLSYS